MPSTHKIFMLFSQIRTITEGGVIHNLLNGNASLPHVKLWSILIASNYLEI